MTDLPANETHFFSVEGELRDLIKVGLARAEPVRVEPAGPKLQSLMESESARLRARFAGRLPSEIDELRPARALYRAFGLDPTRHRPSSEALLRRVLKGESLPRINNAVDLCNLLSLKFWLSLGLYDLARVQGRIVLRRGAASDTYEGIRKGEIHLNGRPALYDSAGPFGNPSSDSLRTSVTPSTTSLLLVIFAPGDYPEARLAAHAEEARRNMLEHLVEGHSTVAHGCR